MRFQYHSCLNPAEFPSDVWFLKILTSFQLQVLIRNVSDFFFLTIHPSTIFAFQLQILKNKSYDITTTKPSLRPVGQGLFQCEFSLQHGLCGKSFSLVFHSHIVFSSHLLLKSDFFFFLCVVIHSTNISSQSDLCVTGIQIFRTVIMDRAVNGSVLKLFSNESRLCHHKS